MASKIKMRVLREFEEGEKLSPQARVIVETIKSAVGLNEDVDRDDLVAKLVESGKLNTRQEPARVVAYYVPKLKEAGLIETQTDKVEGETAADGEKPKRARKAKAEADAVPQEVAVGGDAEADEPETAV